MPVPTLITELSTTAASNYPAGTDSPATLDDVQRAHGAFIAQIRDGTVAVAGTGLTGTASALSIGGNAATATNATNATNVTGTIASGVTATTQSAGDNSTKVATTAMVQSALLGGSGQTMQDLTASRAINTTYTNSTGRTIAVFVTLSVGPNVSWLMYVGSNLVGYDFQINASNRQTTLFALVPPGATYSTAGGLGVYNWKELR